MSEPLDLEAIEARLADYTLRKEDILALIAEVKRYRAEEERVKTFIRGSWDEYPEQTVSARGGPPGDLNPS